MTIRSVGLALAALSIAGAAGAQTSAQTRAAPPSNATAPAATAGPASPTTPAASAPPAAGPAPSPGSTFAPFAVPNPPVDIIATLTASGRFTTLVKAIDAAGLTATLKQPGNLTLFAPTDAAFAALPAGTLDDLLKPENRQRLQHILIYHLINAPVTSAETVGHAAADIPSVAGPALHIDGSKGALTINGANVLQADVKARNGTIQVIDKVLMPAS